MRALAVLGVVGLLIGGCTEGQPVASDQAGDSNVADASTGDQLDTYEGADQGADQGPDADEPADLGADDGHPVASPAVALLQIHALDIWAQALLAEAASMSVSVGGESVGDVAPPTSVIELTDATTYQITLESADHVPANIYVVFDGTLTAESVSLLVPDGSVRPGLSLGYTAVDGDELPTYTLYIGLHHEWFSSQGAPARSGNMLQLFGSGEEAWAQVYEDIKATTTTALVATWWWDSEFEIIRDIDTHHALTPEERWQNTMMGVLESSPLHVRLLVGEFWGTHEIVDWLNTDAAANYYAEKTDDAFEVMGQGNDTADIFLFEPKAYVFGDRVRSAYPESADQIFGDEDPIASPLPTKIVDLTIGPLSYGPQAASWHQKFIVLDGQLAFVGGMNIKGVDWDTSAHPIFEHRRMTFAATEEERLAVLAKESTPDFGPRKDYVVRIEGPSAQDATATFQTRWDHLIDSGAAYSAHSSKFEVYSNIAANDQGVQVQITTTMPTPWGEQSIAETWLNAVAQAQDYILIEDQYWRSPLLVEAILARMKEVPTLRLVVITKPVDTWLDPGCEWTHLTHLWLKTEFPDRYRVYQLKVFELLETWGLNETEGHFADMDVHSKMFIVDDTFMSVGSCNKNNRGLLYEGEMNVAVFDADWVRTERLEILSNILPADTPAADSVAEWWVQLEVAASYNALAYANWEDANFELNLETFFDSVELPDSWVPRGFVYPLSFGLPAECFLEGVGPDST
jgi:phosphatidylserine/phosphatidylglycerophosphate/cardiolipin synthase-like enzyme